MDTIKTRDTRYNHLIGQAIDFSQVDLNKINLMYSCNGVNANGATNANNAAPPPFVPQEQRVTPSPWVVTVAPQTSMPSSGGAHLFRVK